MMKIQLTKGGFGRVQHSVKLTETGHYVYQAYFKQTVGSNTLKMSVMYNWGSAEIVSDVTDKKTGLRTVEFNAKAAGDYMVTVSTGWAYKGEEAYLYRPVVYKADDANKANLLTNSTFENGLSGWTDWSTLESKDNLVNLGAERVEADPSIFAYKDTTPPTFAANAQITAATSSSLSVSWDAASDDTTAAEQIVYKVYASTSAFGGTLSGEPLATVTGTTSAELTGLTANTAYYLAIAAIDEAGNSTVWYGENPAKTSPASSSTTGELVISADVGVAYTLSIPSAPVNMTAAGEQKLGTLYATALRLGVNDTLNVTVAHNDVLTHVNGTNTLAYALSAAAHGSAEKAALAPIAFTNGSTLGEAGGTDLFVSIGEADWNAAPAGVYKDTVTFTVAYTAG